ncbi:MAG: hypothetical protein ACP5QD_06845, partial [Candidatus Ratteibacteria bacterium]
MKINNAAITTIELLTLIALASLGSSIFFPEIVRIKEKTNQALCVTNLKQCYMAHMMYAADFNDYLVPNENPKQPDYPRVWTTVLMGYYKYITDKKIIHCPSVEPQAASISFCYGSWTRNFEKINQLPEKYKKSSKEIILLADSWATNISKEMWLIAPPPTQYYVVSLRHDKKANILFL